MIKTFAPMHSTRDGNNELIYGPVIRNTIKQQNLTIGTSAVKTPTTPLSNRLFIEICNNSSSGQIIYLGDSTVSSSDGFPLYPRQSWKTLIEDDVDIYVISSASGADVRVLEGT